MNDIEKFACSLWNIRWKRWNVLNFFLCRLEKMISFIYTYTLIYYIPSRNYRTTIWFQNEKKFKTIYINSILLLLIQTPSVVKISSEIRMKICEIKIDFLFLERLNFFVTSFFLSRNQNVGGITERNNNFQLLFISKSPQSF